MKNSSYIIFSSILVSTLLSGCMMMGMMKKKDPEAYKVTKRYCTQCHYLKEKNIHTPNNWNPTLIRMYSYMQNQNLMVPNENEKVMIKGYYLGK